MKALIVAATRFEIRPLSDKFAFVQKEDDSLGHYQFRNDKIDILITGMGMTPTAFYLGKQLPGSNYDIAINAGICGSYSDKLDIGKVVNITEESFSELGAENNDQFIPIFELGLADPDETPFHSGSCSTIQPRKDLYSGVSPGSGESPQTLFTGTLRRSVKPGSNLTLMLKAWKALHSFMPAC